MFTLCSAFFVVRTKENVLFQRRYSHPVDKSTGVRSDHTVIWIAVSIYVLVAIVRKRLGLEMSLYQILQILSIALRERLTNHILRVPRECSNVAP